MKSALILIPPTIPGMDSSAGGRIPATYGPTDGPVCHYIPLWICYAAAAVPTAKAMDCAVEGITRETFVASIPEYDIYVFYVNQETIPYDMENALRLKKARPNGLIAFAGPYCTVESELVASAPGVDMAIRGEIEIPLRELCDGKPLQEIKGLTWKNGGSVVKNPDCPPLEDLSSLPWVSKIIHRDLSVEKYRVPYLLHPYMALFTGRGCPHTCTFCLWPQTISGRRYRKRDISDVAEEMIWISKEMPFIREIQIEDDTFTCERKRVHELCDALKGRGITWSCCARSDVPFETLAKMKEAGARNLVIGFESGNDQILKNIKKGLNTNQGKKFVKDCKKLGIAVHGCFVFGLPGETRETMEETMKFALKLNPDSAQFVIASPCEGTAFNAYLRENGYLRDGLGITEQGHLTARYDYPELSGDEINAFTHQAWARFYLRPAFALRHLAQAFRSLDDAKQFVHGVRYLFASRKDPYQTKDV